MTNKDIITPKGDETQKEPTVNPAIKEVADKIQELLEDEGLALQPFLMTSPHGIIPQVQLVEVPKDETEEVRESDK